MLARLLPALLVLAGCPDPTAAPEGGGMSDKPMGGGEMPPGGGAPGQPGMGGPGGGPGGEGGPPNGRPVPPGFQVTAGEGVKLSGVLSYEGEKTGTITIDFLRQGESGSFPDLVHSLTLEKAGPWEVEAPKGAGQVWVVAFLDSNGNGPDPSEPAGRVQEAVSVGSEPLANLDIVLSDSPDLGDLKPGGEEGGKGPGGPGAPPDGAEGAGALPPQGMPGKDGKMGEMMPPKDGMPGEMMPPKDGKPGEMPPKDGK